MAELYITSHQTYLKISFDINYSLVKKKFQQHYLYIWNIFYYWYLYPGPLFLWRFIYSIKLPWSPILLNTETRAAVHLHLYLGMRSSCRFCRTYAIIWSISTGTLKTSQIYNEDCCTFYFFSGMGGDHVLFLKH